ncbi:DNA recombination protein RmuC [uncultured Ferrimonas sp.]|uniref:DNA recombination protein RmuC n=1 Tax=uncultured Ferrimonas sp. TaxID=432640 RepID=UPI0026339425|nr:DNA recombination protein RmuC [uncultured Ferrimonas sp.]
MDFTPLLAATIELKLLLAAIAASVTGLGYYLGRRPLAQLQQHLDEAQDDLSDQRQQLALLQQQCDRLMDIELQWQDAQDEHARLKTVVASADIELKHSTEQLHRLRQQEQELSARLDKQSRLSSLLEGQVKQGQTALEEKQLSFNTQQQQWQQREQELKSELASATEKLESAHARVLSLTSDNQEIKTSLQEKQHHFTEQMQLLEQSKAQLTKQFEQLASEILDRKGQAFSAMNKESMANILSPIHAELKGFKEKVETIHTQETEQRTKLRTELENLQQLNQAINQQADRLTTALQGQKKVQGNWGELMLENVLDNAGLRLGTDYQREQSFNTDEGRLRPDAVVYLPQDKHLVIDAKTSLNAYTRYVNTEDELARSTALKQHAEAVQDRISELASKNYCKLPGLNSPEVVIMFIPVESAYVEALKADETLFQRALEQNILVATPTTLLTSLNIVRQLWRFEDQNKHTAELANRAEKFYDKLRTFLVSMEQVGKQMDNARSSYDKALGQLYHGRGNLIKQAAEFKDLGVSVSKELPAEMVDKAQLELASSDPAALPASVS